VDGTPFSSIESHQQFERNAERVKELCQSDLSPDLWMRPKRQIQYVEMKYQKKN
jgi:hypothetical protein